MKKGYLRLLMVCLIFMAVTIFNLFISIFNEFSLILFLGLALGACFYFIKFEKDKMRFKKDVMLTVFIYGLVYYILTYALGIFTGFYQSPYNLGILSILRHIVPLIIIIILAEIIRYMIVIKGSRYKSILILVTTAFIILDITLIIHTFNLTEPDSLLQFVITILIPVISKNIMLTYLAFKVGYKSPIVYRLIFEVPMFILPIFPSFGLYVSSLLGLIGPAILAYIVFLSFERLKPKEVEGKKNYVKTSTILLALAIPLLVMIYLVTGWFKYSAVTIGSDSMRPSIRRGDVVIVERLTPRAQERLDVGEVLVFEHDNRIIVHRIVRIIEADGNRYFYTQGDNNETEDGHPITEEDIIGRTNFRILFIGLPTVWLNELLN